MARRLEDEDDTPEEKLEATKWKESWMRPWVRWGFPFGGFSVDWRIRQLDRGEKTDDRRLPGHWWGHPNTHLFECPRVVSF